MHGHKDKCLFRRFITSTLFLCVIPSQIRFDRNVYQLLFQSQLIQMQQLSQEQEEIKEQQKVLMQQQERILKEQDALRQREVFIRKIFYDASANMAVADHMVSAMINQSHVISPLVRANC